MEADWLRNPLKFEGRPENTLPSGGCQNGWERVEIWVIQSCVRCYQSTLLYPISCICLSSALQEMMWYPSIDAEIVDSCGVLHFWQPLSMMPYKVNAESRLYCKGKSCKLCRDCTLSNVHKYVFKQKKNWCTYKVLLGVCSNWQTLYFTRHSFLDPCITLMPGDTTW